jgi:hypothetical protein
MSQTTNSNPFDELLNDLELLRKAQCGDGDATIQAAAGDDHDEPDGDEGQGGEGDGDGDEVMGKSFEFELEGGQRVKAFDATELVKSLQDEQANTQETLQKGFDQIATLIKGQSELIKSQGAKIASLESRVSDLSGAGRGRKTALSVHGKQPVGDLQKSVGNGDQLAWDDLMAKSDALLGAGKLTGLEVNTLDYCRRNNVAPAADLLKKVVNTSV